MKIYVIDQAGREHALEALEGWRVMEVIRDWGLPIKAECGGAACCGTCHVRVEDSWQPLLAEPEDEELDMLDTLAASDARSRLSCQILLAPELDGLRVELAPAEGKDSRAA